MKSEPLANHTWLKIGGIADIVIPETKEELITLLQNCHSSNREYRILGNGSNLLVSDGRLDELIIKNTEACTSIQVSGSHVEAGASVMVPQFINTCIQEGLGGYEYLYSIPGTIGGAIFMNAGRGRAYNKTISDNLVSIEVFEDGVVKEIPREQLEFKHRYSTFQEYDNWVILSASFKLPQQDTEVGKRKAKERMDTVNQRERTLPNAGSVFKSGARLPLNRIPPSGLAIGDARFVGKNRICNDGDATFCDVIQLIKLASWLNCLVPPFNKPELEWEIWE